MKVSVNAPSLETSMTLSEPGAERSDRPGEKERLWRGCMTARVAIALVLLALQSVVLMLGTGHDRTLVILCVAYLAVTLVARFWFKSYQLKQAWGVRWLAIIGVDIGVFAALQFIQGSNVNYAPLFALPVLVAAVLGSMTLALGAAASVTLVLLANAAWLVQQSTVDVTAQVTQAALTSAGCFAIALVANQIASRLAREEVRSRSNQLAAKVQTQVNELVIESMTDGILIVDLHGQVRAANPAARSLLGTERSQLATTFMLTDEPGWQTLHDMTRASFEQATPHQGEVTIHHKGQGPRHIVARTRLTPAANSQSENLCVVFLQDQREAQARLRTEKLASMGRMSAAVAHEIRNPLAAIVQANALLEEDLTDPKARQLTRIVQQNALRLEKIVDEILNLARVKTESRSAPTSHLALNNTVLYICQDWEQQPQHQQALKTVIGAPAGTEVAFDRDHLRRVLVNLLDNAHRYASGEPDSIVVTTKISNKNQTILSVWSDGIPMEPSVEKNLFEPFFSSESRSSGLGLYICRELCEGHHATIAFVRSSQKIKGLDRQGNEFVVTFRPERRKSDTTGQPSGRMPDILLS